MNQPQILRATWPYFQKVLMYHGLTIKPTYPHPCIWGGDQQKVEGYTDYNFLLDINSCLSSRPGGLVRDRTDSIRFPFQTASAGSWTPPTEIPDLESCFRNRVAQIESTHQVVNLMWSGGIDSTAMVVSWLLFSSDITKIRVLYSIDSIKENVEFFLHLQTIGRIELIEIGGSVFYNNSFDGVEIHGGAGDYLTASIDESFFEEYGWHGLQSSWKDFFWKKLPDQDFIDFCENWFALAGREISTVLHARWWFYLNKMVPSIGNARVVKTGNRFSISFFCDPLFDAHFYHHIDSLIETPSWKSYKKNLKDFIYEYYPDDRYRNNKCKENSGGYSIFADKAALLTSTEPIFVLSDCELIITDNLPFLSNHEYRKKYGTRFNYLFEQ